MGMNHGRNAPLNLTNDNVLILTQATKSGNAHLPVPFFPPAPCMEAGIQKGFSMSEINGRTDVANSIRLGQLAARTIKRLGKLERCSRLQKRRRQVETVYGWDRTRVEAVMALLRQFHPGSPIVNRTVEWAVLRFPASSASLSLDQLEEEYGGGGVVRPEETPWWNDPAHLLPRQTIVLFFGEWLRAVAPPLSGRSRGTDARRATRGRAQACRRGTLGAAQAEPPGRRQCRRGDCRCVGARGRSVPEPRSPGRGR